MICAPIGRPSGERPIGSAVAGSPGSVATPGQMQLVEIGLRRAVDRRCAGRPDPANGRAERRASASPGRSPRRILRTARASARAGPSRLPLSKIHSRNGITQPRSRSACRLTSSGASFAAEARERSPCASAGQRGGERRQQQPHIEPRRADEIGQQRALPRDLGARLFEPGRERRRSPRRRWNRSAVSGCESRTSTRKSASLPWRGGGSARR